MKRKIRFFLPLVAALTLSSCNFNFFGLFGGNNGNQTISKTQGYYADYDLELDNADLETELQRMCFEKHTKYILYSNYNSYCSKKTLSAGKYTNSIEAISDGATKNQWFYTGKEASGYGTREHVWPCANSASLWVHDGASNQGVHNVDYSQYVGGGSDLYHVRTSNSVVNTARGNSKFVDFDDPEFDGIRSEVIEKGENGGKYTIKLQGYETTAQGVVQYAKKAEPADEMKGDIARILVYVWIHYGRHGYTPEGQIVNGNKIYAYSDMIGSLNLQNIMGYDTLAKCCKKLVEWNNLDKPSEVEKLRNDTVQKIQGNRNPFVDFPELMEQLFDSYLD